MNASQVIARELDAGESLLWSDQPRQGWVLRGSDAFLIPFSLVWGGAAIMWETIGLMHPHGHGQQTPIFFVLWGIPFVVVGLYLIVGRFWVDALLREHTYYGVTDRRVVIMTGMFGARPSGSLAMIASLVMGLAHPRVKTMDLRTLTDITMTERWDGSGTITFGPPNPYSAFAGVPWPGTAALLPPSFELIPHVKSVYQQIRGAQRKAS